MSRRPCRRSCAARGSDMSREAAPAPAASLRSLVALVTAVTGLVGALAAWHKTPDEPAARESYTVLQEAVERLTARTEALEESLQTTQQSFEAYVRAKEGDGNVEPQLAPTAPGQTPRLRVKVRPNPHPHAAAATTSAPEPTEVLLPPPAHSEGAPASVRLPAYDTIEQRAKK